MTGRKAFLAVRNANQFQPPGPKLILQRPERRQEPDKIERKVDFRAEQLSEVPLLMKKNQTMEQSDYVRTCSFYKEPGHGAGLCRSNPHQDTRCPNYGKLGRGQETCWVTPRTEQPQAGAMTPPLVLSNGDSCNAQVTYVDEAKDGEAVTVTKRNVDGEPLPNQLKTHKEVAIPRLLNPPAPFEVQKRALAPRLGPRRSFQKKKLKKTSKNNSLQEHVGKNNVISELANAPSGLTFRQLIHGDANVSKKDVGRLFTKQGGPRRVFADHANINPRRLRLVTLKVYGTEAGPSWIQGPYQISFRPS